MSNRSDPLKILESLLVQEFRTCQALESVTRQERSALAGGDAPRMQSLAEEKESILDHLYALEDARQSYLVETAARLAPVAAEPADAALMAILAAANPSQAERLRTLQAGILTLTGQVRDLTEGNYALAEAALQQANHRQQTLGEAGQGDLPALFAAVLAARQALTIGDKDAVSNAIAGMESTLERLGRSLQAGVGLAGDAGLAGEPTAVPQTPPAASSPPATGEKRPAGFSLVETMANLHRQQAAYQAVLRVSRRMLAA